MTSNYEKLAVSQPWRETIKVSLQLQYAEISYSNFSKEYSSANWFGRKVSALPLAFYFGVINTIYHLSRAVLSLLHSKNRALSFKLYTFTALRDLQEGIGCIISIFNDRLGSYYREQSRFHKMCYQRAFLYLSDKSKEELDALTSRTFVLEAENLEYSKKINKSMCYPIYKTVVKAKISSMDNTSLIERYIKVDNENKKLRNTDVYDQETRRKLLKDHLISEIQKMHKESSRFKTKWKNLQEFIQKNGLLDLYNASIKRTKHILSPFPKFDINKEAAVASKECEEWRIATHRSLYEHKVKEWLRSFLENNPVFKQEFLRKCQESPNPPDLKFFMNNARFFL